MMCVCERNGEQIGIAQCESTGGDVNMQAVSNIKY